MGNFGKCETQLSIPKIVLNDKDGGISRMTFLNPDETKVRKVQVDGCALKEGKRCDYLVIAATGVEHFVELKGSHVKDGVEQIEASIPRLSKDPARGLKHSYVICTRSPLSRNDIRIFQVRFKKRLNSTLTVKGPTYQVSI